MSPFWQLINGPAEAGQKFTFTLRRIDLVTMITTDLVKSCSLPSIPRHLATTFGSGASGGAAALSASEGVVT